MIVSLRVPAASVGMCALSWVMFSGEMMESTTWRLLRTFLHTVWSILTDHKFTGLTWSFDGLDS